MKEPLALLMNDLHIDRNTVSEFEKNWEEAVSICVKKGIFDIVIGGDVFTSSSSQSLPVLLAVRHALLLAKSKDIHVTIAEGNHDLVSEEELEGYCHIFASYPGIDVVDVYQVLEWSDCDYRLVVMSYFPENGSFSSRLESMREKLGDVSNVILYIHEGVHGALGDFEVPKEVMPDLFDGFKMVLCGHYHNRCQIKDTEIYYIGASRAHNFGEYSKKGYTVLYDDGTIEFIQNKVNIRYHTIEIDYDELDSLEDNLPGNSLYKTRVKINCTDAQSKLIDKQRILDMGIGKVEIVSEKVAKVDIESTGIDEKYDNAGIRDKYKAFCKEKDIDNKLGLKYLEKL